MAKFAPDGNYQLRLNADELPPADAFCSLAGYTAADLNLIPNPANRYSVGDHTPDLTMDQDGGLTLHLQPESPGNRTRSQLAANLTSPPWFLILRLYWPRSSVIVGTWKCPPITRVT